jgi:hypothetical protein
MQTSSRYKHMKETFYSIHQVDFKVTTDSPIIASVVNSFLSKFQKEALNNSMALDASFKSVHSRSEIQINPPCSVQVVFDTEEAELSPNYSSWRYKLYRDSDRNINIADFYDLGLLLIDPQRRCLEGYLIDSNALCEIAVMNFFRFAFIELLKLDNLYTIHAAGLEKHGCGILIPGYSGQGKTTCCISLLRAGYHCLSDDDPLLRETEAGLELLPFLNKIDVTEKTIKFFPELREASRYLHQGVIKRYFYAEDIYPHARANSCKPALIIFPQIVDCLTSHLEVLPKNKAIEKLLPHTLLVLDKNMAKKQFQTCCYLVQQATCYQLYLGKDILKLPLLIDQLIKEKISSEESACFL